MKELLLAGFNDFAGAGIAANISNSMQAHGIIVKNIDKQSYNMPVGSFLSDDAFITKNGIAGKISELTETAKKSGPYTGPEISRKIIIMCDIDRNSIDELLHTLTSCGVTKDDLKAVLTPINSCFTILHIADELLREHEALN